MQCYSQIVPASGVTQSLALPFTAINANNLIVARTSLLQIYERRSSERDGDGKLVLISQHQLAGTITNLGRVHLESSKSGGDAILISFRDAKLSLVEWDASQHTISTISIHYYESHNLQSAPWLQELRDCVSHLTVDPNSRCAAFNFGITNLAIVPFHQKPDDLAIDDELGDMDGEDVTRNLVNENGTVKDHKTPYHPSFVLPLTALDPALLHPVDLTFLYEYRDPTVGILYSTAARSSNLASERKDVSIYSMYALDIEQRASTNLQSVTNLPNDIHTVKALPQPVSGSLLVGGNELIHIDQGGKATGIGVNEFAKEASAFPLTDQSHHQMRLEGCQVAQLDQSNGDMLIVLRTGELVVLSFRLDGRSVAGLSLRRLDDEILYRTIRGRSSCISTLASGEVFVGSDEADSALLGNASRPGPLKRQLSRVQSALNGRDVYRNGHEDADEMDEDDDDDIFATTNGQVGNTVAASDAHISVVDTLPSVAPLHESAFGRATRRKRQDDETDERERPSSEGLELAVSYGRGRSGGIAFFSQSLLPSLKQSLKHGRAKAIWPCYDGADSGQRFIISERTENDDLFSSLWSVNDNRMHQARDTEFPVRGAPIAVGIFRSTQKTIYVTGSEIRVYDMDFAIAQIIPIVDDDEGQLARATRADFAEPYLTIFKDDQTLLILKADKNGELEELELPPTMSNLSLTSASLYVDSFDFFYCSRFNTDAATRNVLIVLLTTTGALRIVHLSHPEIEIFSFESAHFLTTQLGHDVRIEKHWRNGDELASAMLGDIGDGTDVRPYLIIRNTTGDVILYEPFAVPDVVGSYKFRKIATRNAEYNNVSTPEEDGEAEPTLPPMQAIVSSGYSAVFIPGDSPMIITKTASSLAQIYPFGSGDVVSLCAVQQQHGTDLTFVNDKGDICQASLPSDLVLGISPWVVQRKRLGHEVISLAYYEGTSSYIIATHTPASFRLPQEDEWHPEWASEETDFLPTTSTSTIQLISSITHNTISQYSFDVDERVLDVKTMSLETSEITHRQQELVVVGTGTVKGENIVTRGHIYLFSVAEVVPRPGVPESDLKLKLLSTEEVRGAVTAITSIGSQGFVLAAQGQKCMVRGLREDLSILPVAFMDMRYYTSIAKSLPGTGLCILGDAFSGLWLVGYSEEPYKLQLLSRDLENPSVIAADFITSDDNKELFVIAADDDGDLRVLQYDPENPKSERGQKLLLRSSFHTADFPSTMKLIPRSPTSYEAAALANEATSPQSDDAMAVDMPPTKLKSQLLMTHASGAISLMTTLDEASYRRLSALQNILIGNLDHPCSLNPRAFRAVETDGMGGRGVIDGDVVKRWLELNSHHKANTADKAGARAVWEIRGDLEIVLGGGLGFMT